MSFVHSPQATKIKMDIIEQISNSYVTHINASYRMRVMRMLEKNWLCFNERLND